YLESGVYTTTLTVTDDDGGTDRIFVTKVINDQPPVAILTASSFSVNVGEIVSFDASGSYDPDGVIVSYLWDFGDQKSSTGITVNHIYNQVGSYNVTLTIEDNNGTLSFVISKIIVTEESILNLALISLVVLGISVLTLTLLYGMLIRRRKTNKT
ncbi:MAG: PKD domain-containing protein, partial [Candidatus Bathyarchaeota archaeon]